MSIYYISGTQPQGALMDNHQPKQYRLLRLLDLDDHFRKSMNSIILNEFDIRKMDYSDMINMKMYSHESDINFIATCECGDRTSNFYEGIICPTCHTEVKSPLSFGRDRLPHKVWIKFPDGIKVLHPVFYRVLSKWLNYNRGKDNYIDTILDPFKELPLELEGIGRGFNYFHDNFDQLIETFATLPRKQTNYKWIKTFVTKYRHLAFVQHLPALSNILHAITNADDAAENSKTYTDEDSKYFLEAVHILSFMKYNTKKSKSLYHIDKKLFNAYKSYMTYNNIISDKRLSKKTGLIRKHMFGSRFHWSFRSVIVPIVGPHQYDELHIPWQVGVNLLQIHIISKLMNKYNHSLREAMEIHMQAETKYIPIVDQIMQELINENPYPGLPCLFNRNPSIRRGSTMLLFITYVKKYIDDKSIGMSNLILKPYNADYDGDALNGKILLELQSVKHFLKQHPSNLYLDANNPSVSTDISIPKQPLVTLNSFSGHI